MAEPRRIVSLLPSATEICFALGLSDRLVGVSHECDFPPGARALPALTTPAIDPRGSSLEIDREVRARMAAGLSIHRVDEERLRALRPDLIVTQDTCEVCAVSLDEVRAAARRIAGPEVELLSLAPLVLADVLEDIVSVGRAAGVEARARAYAAELRVRLERLARETALLARPSVLVLEWLAPPMAAGHWTPELVRIAGGEPVLAPEGAPTGPIEWERIAARDPDFVLIAPCGFRIEQTLRELGALERQPGFSALAAVRAGRVAIADGNAYFNRPGPRLAESAELAALALHPERFTGRFGFDRRDLVRWDEI